MTDLVVLSLEAWDEVWRRNQHLVVGLLRTDPSLRVLFVEPPRDPLHAALGRARPRTGRGLRPGPALDGVGAGRLWLMEPTKWLPRRIDPRTDDRLTTSVLRAVAWLGFDAPLLWVNATDGAHLLARTSWRALYDVTDDWLAADRPPAEHDRLVQDEAYLLAHCAEVVVCSPLLARTKAHPSLTLVPNAVDLDAYRRVRARPADLPDGPVAVYVGTVHTDRMDLDLCAATARAVDGIGHLVLVGPAPLSPADRQRLTDAGVVLAGPRDHDDVPGYLQHADVLVVPHVSTAFTDSLDPIKVYEYRAAGRPVVSTPVAGFRELEGDGVTVATGEAFVAAVRSALATPAPARSGPPDASVPSWADRVVAMRAVLDRLAAS